ncbi:hypothetical protein BDK51DRAFT_34755, partial [Blyttiomyces helicus]
MQLESHEIRQFGLGSYRGSGWSGLAKIAKDDSREKSRESPVDVTKDTLEAAPAKDQSQPLDSALPNPPQLQLARNSQVTPGKSVAAVAAGTWYVVSSKAAAPKPASSEKKKKKSGKKGAAASKDIPVDAKPAASASASPEAQPAISTAAEEPFAAYPAHLFPEDVDALERSERANIAKEAKTLGNQFYQEKKYSQALDLYSQAIKLVPDDAVFYSNRAACYSMMQNYEKVIDDCTSALTYDAKYIKALNRRAGAYEILEKWEPALNDYTSMCLLEEYKAESSLKAMDRILKHVGKVKATELFQSHNLILLVFDALAYMDSFRITSRGAPEIADREAVEEGDVLIKAAFAAVAERKWAEARKACIEGIETGKISAGFESLAYNLRGTFGFLMGD